LSSLQMIDPGRSYKNPTPPPVHVEGLVADGKSYTLASPITLPPLSRDLHIDYTALSFVMPQRIGFRYILEGRDTGWQNPGLRRQAFYSDLRPGSYRFRVIASNNDGVWNETGATLDFKVAAAWYQTIWFRSLCFVAGVLLLAGSALALTASIGVVRFPDTLARMHAATKPQVLGLLLVLAGAAARLRGNVDVGMLILTGLFTLITAPVVANRVGRLAYRERCVRADLLTRDELQEDELQEDTGKPN